MIRDMKLLNEVYSFLYIQKALKRFLQGQFVEKQKALRSMANFWRAYRMDVVQRNILTLPPIGYASATCIVHMAGLKLYKP